MQERYDEVWNNIRGANINCIDFLLSCGFGKTKRQICDWFLQSDILKQRFIDGLSVKSLAKKYNVKDYKIAYKINKDLDIIKIRLAENNLLHDVNYKDNENYYEYLKTRINKQGVIYVYLNDGVSTKDIAISLDVSENAVKHVIMENRKRIKKMLTYNKIKFNKQGVNLYIRAFGEHYKFCENIPRDYLYKLYDILNSNKKVFEYVTIGIKDSVEEQKCIDVLDEVEFYIKNYLNNTKKSVGINRR